MVEHAIIESVKHLEEIEQSIPDNFRVASILSAVGAAVIAAAILVRIPPESGIEPAAPVVIGSLLLFVGAFILLRRAVWKLQDKRAPRITSLHLR